jgi:putative transcriptional regulator
MYVKLREMRNESGISIPKILDLLKISKATYYRKEKGKIKFSLYEAKKIAELFGKNIEEIFFEKSVEKNATYKRASGQN